MDVLFDAYEHVVRGEARLQDLIVGFIDPNEQIADPTAAAHAKADDDSDDDEAETRRHGPRSRGGRKRASRRSSACTSATSNALLDERRQERSNEEGAQGADGRVHGAQARAEDVRRSCVVQLRETVNGIRGHERQVMALCVRDAGMPRKDFIASFPKNETNTGWVDKHIRAKRKHSSQLAKLKDDIVRAQKRLQKIESRSRAFDRRRSRRSTARSRWARRRRVAPRRRWSRRTCVS